MAKQSYKSMLFHLLNRVSKLEKAVIGTSASFDDRDACLNMELDKLAVDVALVFRVNKHKLLSKDRTNRVSDARQAFCQVAFTVLSYNYSDIARYLGRDHGTIMHNVKACRERTATEQDYAAKHNVLVNAVRSWNA